MSDDFDRDILARLFPKRADAQSPADPQPRGNFSPHEGTQPAAPDPDQETRDFVRDLFTPHD